ncbi:Hypothetical predicted protein, partial [Prunus dulcis]
TSTITTLPSFPKLPLQSLLTILDRLVYAMSRIRLSLKSLLVGLGLSFRSAFPKTREPLPLVDPYLTIFLLRMNCSMTLNVREVLGVLWLLNLTLKKLMIYLIGSILEGAWINLALVMN